MREMSIKEIACCTKSYLSWRKNVAQKKGALQDVQCNITFTESAMAFWSVTDAFCQLTLFNHSELGNYLRFTSVFYFCQRVPKRVRSLLKL